MKKRIGARVVLSGVIAVIALVVGFSATAFAQNEASGVITGGTITPTGAVGYQIQKIPMAVPLFRNEGGGASDLPRHLADVLTDDMEMSGEFEVIDRARYIEDPQTAGVKQGEFDMADWKIVGAHYLVKGAFEQSGNSLKISARLYNVASGALVVGKEFEGTVDDQYKMVHLFSSEIFLALFGDRGFFGTRIAYTSGTRSQRDIYVMDIDGRNNRRMTNLGLLIMTPRWSPDGKKIVFSATGPSIDASIYILDVASGKAKKIFSVDQGVALTPRFSPSGTRIVAALSLGQNTDIYEMDLEGKNLKPITNDWPIDIYPTFSPDGNQMLMISDRTGKPQLYKMGVDGSDLVRISYFGAYNQAPAWSPKGNKIAYASLEGGYTIYLIDSDGGEPYALTVDLKTSCEYPTFSPDGRALLFSCETKAGRALYLRTVNDSFTKILTKGTALDTNPDWSPLPPAD